MHVLEPQHTKLKPEEVEKLLKELNISLAQLPKIKITDPSLPQGCEISDVIKIEGRWFPTTIIYKDMMKQGNGTEFKMTSIKFNKEIPEYIFTRAALKK